MENASTEFSLESHSAILKEGAYHQLVVIFTKDNMDADKSVTVVNITPVSFIGGPSKQERTGNIQGAGDTDRSVSGITDGGVPVE